MIKATINGIDKVMHQESQEYFLDVRFTLDNDGAELGERRLAFALDTTPDAIKAELARYCATLESDAKVAEANAAFEAANTVADETIAALVGSVVESDTPLPSEEAK